MALGEEQARMISLPDAEQALAEAKQRWQQEFDPSIEVVVVGKSGTKKTTWINKLLTGQKDLPFRREKGHDHCTRHVQKARNNPDEEAKITMVRVTTEQYRDRVKAMVPEEAREQFERFLEGRPPVMPAIPPVEHFFQPEELADLEPLQKMAFIAANLSGRLTGDDNSSVTISNVPMSPAELAIDYVLYESDQFQVENATIVDVRVHSKLVSYLPISLFLPIFALISLFPTPTDPRLG